MDNGRSILNEEDKLILEDIKSKIEAGIILLKERNIFTPLIQIELECHIKKILKDE